MSHTAPASGMEPGVPTAEPESMDDALAELKLLRGLLQVVKEDLHVKNEQLDFLYASVRASAEADKQRELQHRVNLESKVHLLEQRLTEKERKEVHLTQMLGHLQTLQARSAPAVPWTELPPGASHVVFSFLDFGDVCALSQVCTAWRPQLADTALWRSLYVAHFGPPPGDAAPRAARTVLTPAPSPRSDAARAVAAVASPVAAAPPTAPTCADSNWQRRFARTHTRERAWASGRPLQTTLSGHKGTVTCLALTPEHVVSGSDDGSIILWSLVDPRRHLTLPPEAPHASPDELKGRLAMAGGFRSTSVAAAGAGSPSAPTPAPPLGSSPPSTDAPLLMQQHHRQTREVMRQRSFHGHGGPVWCLDLCDSLLISGSYDLTIKLWDVKTGQCQRSLRGHEGWVSCLASRGTTLVSGSWDSTLRVWDLEAGVSRSSMGGAAGDAVHCLQWAPGTPVVAAGGRRGDIALWDVERATALSTRLVGHAKHVYALDFQDQRRVVSASGDNTVKVWDTAANACGTTLMGHTSAVMCVQSDGQNKVLSGSYDKTVALWDLRRPDAPVRSLAVHSGAVFCLAFDDTRLASGSADCTVKLCKFSD